jgi:hypothetical protein
LTTEERARLPHIELELIKHGIVGERWELAALTCGALITFGEVAVHFGTINDWTEFN